MNSGDRAGLYLDLDGTLADSSDALLRVYTQFLSDHGCIASQEEFDQLNGPTVPEIVLYLKNKYELCSSVQTLFEDYNQLIMGIYDTVPAKPGVAELIASAKYRGFPTAIVTSNSNRVARRWLHRNGFEKDIDAVVGREDAPRGKPHPDLYFKALAATHCEASISIAVEDSDQGLQAALGAGIKNCFLCKSLSKGVPGNIEVLSTLKVLARRIQHGTL